MEAIFSWFEDLANCLDELIKMVDMLKIYGILTIVMLAFLVIAIIGVLTVVNRLNRRIDDLENANDELRGIIENGKYME